MREKKTKGSQFLPMVPHPCADMHRTHEETLRELKTMLSGHESTFLDPWIIVGCSHNLNEGKHILPVYNNM